MGNEDAKPVLVTLSDVMAELNERLTNPPVWFADGCIMLRTHPGGYEYPVPAERCKTPEDICEWVVHLGEKTWFTGEMARLFVLVAAKHVKPELWRGNVYFRPVEGQSHA
jgi:hypothetical protein